MLTKPEHGWTNFQLTDDALMFCLSYLTDIPMDWLDQAIRGLETITVFSVHGVCEPGRMICTVSYWNCYLIFEEERREGTPYDTEHFHIGMLDFCRKLYDDITINLEAWVHWNDPFYKDDTYYDTRRAELQKRLDTLAKLIEDRSKKFIDPHRCIW